LSARLPVMPFPRKTINPAGITDSISSLRRKGAALACLVPLSNPAVLRWADLADFPHPGRCACPIKRYLLTDAVGTRAAPYLPSSQLSNAPEKAP
jgi:hypothetical protein